MLRVLNVCGARPNFMKIAPLMDRYADVPGIEPLLVHTGQHYDEKMSDLFFRELGIPEPDVNLEVGPGSHAVQTAEIMLRFEPVVERFRPDWVVVVGDVNSTVACSLVAAKLGVRVAHVEAGLRSGDWTMPEEINRVLTDRLSDLLFVTEPSGVENLRREGIAPERIHLVGNVMIDTLLKHRRKAAESTVLADLGLRENGYALVTLHRPSNVDDAEALAEILAALAEISREVSVVFAVHPRTRQRIESFGLGPALAAAPDLRLIDPIGYLDFLRAMSDARVVLTDSGGIQEETTILGVPCLTLRRNTERPITVSQGTNQLVDPDREAILRAWQGVVSGPPRAASTPELWDGKASQRIVETLLQSAR